MKHEKTNYFQMHLVFHETACNVPKGIFFNDSFLKKLFRSKFASFLFTVR